MAEGCTTPFRRTAVPGRMRHGAREDLPRHRHDHGFAALVLAGGYVEAGDTGRHRLEAGDVLVHQAFESHLDRFDARGADVLILPLEDTAEQVVLGQVADLDTIVRLAELDQATAAQALGEQLVGRQRAHADWPDLLAQALHDDPSLVLSDWADCMGLHLGSISRGFRQVFSVTPAAYRATQRAHRATQALSAGDAPLSAIAADCGFADQAHMTRAVRHLTGLPPLTLRARLALNAPAS
jgi:AraC-like DNA-binding protein